MSHDGVGGHLLCGGFAYRRLDYAPGDPIVIRPVHPTRDARHRTVGICGDEPLGLGSCAGGPAEFEADPRRYFAGVTADDVCTPGWAADHRHITEAMRAQVYREYGFNFDYCQGPEPGVAYQACEVDHLIPLELGGSNDMKNLWPQPYSCTLKAMCGATYDPRPGAAEKDQLENELHRLVCHDKLTLADAQRCIASNWALR
jgi:hypothetical protein